MADRFCRRPSWGISSLFEPVFGYGHRGKFSLSWSKPVASRFWEPFLSGFGVWPRTSSGANQGSRGARLVPGWKWSSGTGAQWTTDRFCRQPSWGIPSFSELDLAPKRRPMPSLFGDRTETLGAPSDAPQAIHVSSNYHGM